MERNTRVDSNTCECYDSASIFGGKTAISLWLIVATIGVQAQLTVKGSSEAYIGALMKAAPASVVKGATIVPIQKDGSTHTIQAGSNGFTCMMIDNCVAE